MATKTTSSAERIARHLTVLLASGVLVAVSACSDDSKSDNGCETAVDCQRGQICDEGSCAVVQCASLSDCPGSDVACVEALGACTARECSSGGMSCADGAMCIESGPFQGSCAGGRDAGAMPIICSNDDACGSLGAGYRCCGGLCGDNCPDAAAPMSDVGGDPMADAGPGVLDGGRVNADAGAARLCSPCGTDDDCAALGAGAECSAIGAGAFCTSSCASNPDACPDGFRCQPGLDQCLPLGFRCDGCFSEGCPAGQLCDPMSAECIEPRPRCGTCTSDDGCRAGLTCLAHGGTGARFCLEPCAAGDACGDGFECSGGACEPVSGRCDACGGTCAEPTPQCDAESGQCRECGRSFPCTAPQACNASGQCEDGMAVGCIGDADCVNIVDRPVCFLGQCVECLQPTDCPARHRCRDDNTCEFQACSGVECQAGSECDPATGRCAPGCDSAMDCADSAIMDCNRETGQCFYLDGGCDPAGSEAVCAPGGACVPSIFTASMNQCTCRKLDPADPLEQPDQHLVGCPPGLTCFDLRSLGELFPPDMGGGGMEPGIELDAMCIVPLGF